MKLFLFDIDGTLVSVERSASRTLLRRVVEDIFGVVLPDDFEWSLGGKTDLQIMTEMALTLNVPPERVQSERERIKRVLAAHTEAIEHSHIRLLQGAREFVAALAAQSDAQLGLVTGNVAETAYLKLRPHDLDAYFPFGAFGCDHHDRAILPPLALERARAHAKRHEASRYEARDFSPERTLIIGDTLNDIRCAKANNMKVLAVATGPVRADDLRKAGADYTVENFADLPAILDIANKLCA
jgi:phosphoglycolate phosphatase-like HAD superfamily hydrolase